MGIKMTLLQHSFRNCGKCGPAICGFRLCVRKHPMYSCNRLPPQPAPNQPVPRNTARTHSGKPSASRSAARPIRRHGRPCISTIFSKALRSRGSRRRTALAGRPDKAGSTTQPFFNRNIFGVYSYANSVHGDPNQNNGLVVFESPLSRVHCWHRRADR